MQTFPIKKIHIVEYFKEDYVVPHVCRAGKGIVIFKSPYYGFGFSLLELLVVLALAALAATVVGGSAHAFMERSQYHKAVRDVANQLGYARMLCMQEGRKVTVTYDPQTRQLAVDGGVPLTLPASIQIAWQALHPEDAAPAQPLFVFQANGGAVGGRLAVSRANGQEVVFQVHWLLGMVEQTR